MEQKFKVGDKVQIIKYGSKAFTYKKDYEETTKMINQGYTPIEHKMFFGKEMPQELINKIQGTKQPKHILSENEDIWVHDMHPNLVGQKGIIVQVKETQGIIGYAIHGIKGKHAWYCNEQLELIENG